MATTSLYPHTPILVLKSIFKSFDTDNNQTLDEKEFNKLLSSIGITSKEQVDACRLLADENADGFVSLSEFVDWVQTEEILTIIMDSEKFYMLYTICNKFQSVDTDCDKIIKWDEFRDFFVEKDVFDINDAKEWWNEIDVNNDDKITFKAYWNHCKKLSGAFDKSKTKQNATNKLEINRSLSKLNIPQSIPESNTNKMEDIKNNELDNEKNIIQQLVIFGYNKCEITEALSSVIDKYNINEIQTYLEEKQEKQQSFISIEEAMKVKGLHKEKLISDADFEKVFGINRESFNALKIWKQKLLKKTTGFF